MIKCVGPIAAATLLVGAGLIVAAPGTLVTLGNHEINLLR
jgi:hypothetical protein